MMKAFLLAPLLIISSGCATTQINHACVISEVAGRTLAQLLTDLQAAGVTGPLAEKLALALSLGQTTAASVCAIIAAPPVVVPN